MWSYTITEDIFSFKIQIEAVGLKNKNESYRTQIDFNGIQEHITGAMMFQKKNPEGLNISKHTFVPMPICPDSEE